MKSTTVDRKRAPEPSVTRTNRDWVMIILGLSLTILFLAGGYWSIAGHDSRREPKMRGPVKHPEKLGALPRSYHAAYWS